MTLAARLQRRSEVRNFGTLQGYGSQSIVDPAAIPPPGMGGSVAAGMLVNETTALTIDAVQTALHVLTQGIIKRGNLRAYTEAISPAGATQRKWQTTPNEFLENSFAFPGPRSNSQSRGRGQMVVSMALFGESWLYVLTSDRVGNANSVQVLHPLLLNIKKNTSGTVTDYEYGTGQNRIPLDEAKLYHVVRSDLPNHERALSNIKESSITYGVALAALQYTSLWFAQGAQPNFILTSDDAIAEDVANRLSQKFRVEHSGIRQFFLPLVTGQNVKVQPVGVSADDAQMLQTLEYVRTCIGAMFGIPMHLLGGIADKGLVWGANHEEVAQSMEDVTYAAYVTPMEEAFSDLLPTTLKAAWPSTLVQPNMLNLSQALQFLRQAQLMTQNEMREAYLGLGPLPGGDELMTPLASNVAPEQTDDAAEKQEQQDDGSAFSGEDGD